MNAYSVKSPQQTVDQTVPLYLFSVQTSVHKSGTGDRVTRSAAAHYTQRWLWRSKTKTAEQSSGESFTACKISTEKKSRTSRSYELYSTVVSVFSPSYKSMLSLPILLKNIWSTFCSPLLCLSGAYFLCTSFVLLQNTFCFLLSCIGYFPETSSAFFSEKLSSFFFSFSETFSYLLHFYLFIETNSRTLHFLAYT